MYGFYFLIKKDFSNGNNVWCPCLHKFNKNLREMFTCTKCVQSSHDSKNGIEKEIVSTILQEKDL